ncbi:hypothetical protein FI667_g12129, partial [Globisporangium splendens]
MHPHFGSLAAHWSLSSGSVSGEELDLSGHVRHLIVVCEESSGLQLGSMAPWLRLAPARFMPARPNFIVETLQDSSDSNCRFLVTIKHRSQYRNGDQPVQQQQQQLMRPHIVFICNFRAAKNASVTELQEHGKWIIKLFHACIRDLPEHAIVGILKPGVSPAEVLPLTQMSAAGKNLLIGYRICVWQVQACKSLDQLVIPSVASADALLDMVRHAIHILEEECAGYPLQSISENPGVLSCSNVVVVNGNAMLGTSASSTQSLFELESEMSPIMQQSTNLHFLHLHPLISPPISHRERTWKDSRVVTEYICCEHDLEWVLASVMHRIRRIVARHGELHIQTVGDDDACLTLHESNDDNLRDGCSPVQCVRYGLCEQEQPLVLSGVISFSDKSVSPNIATNCLPFIELRFQWVGPGNQVHVAWTSLRLRQDVTNEMHIARVARNQMLSLRHDSNSVLLLAQRRQLMDEKAQFHHALARHEVAALENAFKRTNIMKEELWARRKWIIERGLRKFEEDELFVLEQEAIASAEKFQARFDTLQHHYTVNARENSRGGGADNHSSSRRVLADHYLADLCSLNASRDEHESSDELAQQYEKITLKVDLLTKRFRDIESRMEDMVHSVRVAQTKGFVILNDARKAWMVLYKDLMDSGDTVLAMRRQKTHIEQRLLFLEHEKEVTECMLAEIKAINSSILHYEKEPVKRKQRVFLSMKDMLRVLVDEFETSMAVDTAERIERQCKLLRACARRDDDADHRHRHNNAVHAWLFGLHHFCVDATQEPFCKRICLQEHFLWLDQEQSGLEGQEDNAGVDARRQECWAVILVTYNALFSSSTAIRNLKSVLASAEQAHKPVLHVELEPLFANVDEFKAIWQLDAAASMKSSAYSVEKEYLAWKHNVGAFQAAMRSLHRSSATTTASSEPSKLRFTSIPAPSNACLTTSATNDVSARARRVHGDHLPCMVCCWPLVARTAHVLPNKASMAEDSDASPSLLAIVKATGEWIDGLTVAATQTAVRSHNLDPSKNAPLSMSLEQWRRNERKLRETQWEEAFARRKVELQRQVGKIFKVYEEEANELSHLQFLLEQRKQALITSCAERQREWDDEQKLVCTLMELKEREDLMESSQRANEAACMVEQELVQLLSQTDSCLLHLETLEGMEDDDNDAGNSGAEQHARVAEEAREAFHESLKLCARRILELGKVRVETQLATATKRFAVQEACDQSHHLSVRSQFEQQEISRVAKVYDRGLAIVADLVVTCHSDILGDARAFLEVARMEQREFSRTTSEGDLRHALPKLACDVNDQSSFRVGVLFDAFVSDLMLSTARAFREKTVDATRLFQPYYSPRPVSFSDGDALDGVGSAFQSVPPEILKLKECCTLDMDEPSNTWRSLQHMASLVDAELLHLRRARHLACEFKMQFQNEFVGNHLTSASLESKAYLQHLMELLSKVSKAKAESLRQRAQTEHHFRASIEDREQCKSRLLAMQSKLSTAKQRNKHLAQMLQHCRDGFGKAVRVNELLRNFKMDPLYKSWFSVSEFHTSLIAELYELRTHCGDDIDAFEAEVVVLERQLTRLCKTVDVRRLEWFNTSIKDVQLCTRAERLQDLVHRALDQIEATDKARAVHLLMCFDPRHKWLHHDALMHIIDASSSPSGDANSGSGTEQYSSSNKTLVQLSIARLDAIKQEKWCDLLARKLRVYEKIRKQESEKHQMLSGEAQRYRSLDSVLVKRVVFVKHHIELTGGAAAPSRGRNAPSEQLDATSCATLTNAYDALQSSRSRREHVATSYRMDAVIQRLTQDLRAAEMYLTMLKRNDRALYEAATAPHGTDNDSSRTHSLLQGYLPFVLLVTECYVRQQWSKQSFETTTVLGAKLQCLKDAVASRTSPRSSGVGAADSIEEGNARKMLQDSMVEAELSLLLNRFECRIAEHTSEVLCDRLDGIAAVLVKAPAASASLISQPEAVAATGVLPLSTLESWLVSSMAMYQNERANLVALLRCVTTEADSRDAAGNIANVIYGTSLTSSEIKQLYASHVTPSHGASQPQPWNVVLVVVFFACLFRRAALQKAAIQYKSDAARIASDALAQWEAQRAIAATLRLHAHDISSQHAAESDAWLLQLIKETTTHSVIGPRTRRWKKQIKACLRLLHLELEGLTTHAGVLACVSLGLISCRPAHRSLAELYDTEHSIEKQAQQLAAIRTHETRQSPPPTGLEIVNAANNVIQIKWLPIADEPALMYAAEIRLGGTKEGKDASCDPAAAPRWERSVCNASSNGSHSFYNLRMNATYCVRVCAGFSASRWGPPSAPLFVKTRAAPSRHVLKKLSREKAD